MAFWLLQPGKEKTKPRRREETEVWLACNRLAALLTLIVVLSKVPKRTQRRPFMIIHVTEKLNKKLKLGPLTKVDTQTGAHLRWCANLFTAQRVQYILTTNASSLFSVVMYGRGITDENEYLKQFLSFLGEHLAELNMRMFFDRIIAPNTGTFTFSKTSDRSVLGSMNDMVKACKMMLEEDDLSPWDLMKEINETPYSALNGFPREVFENMPFKPRG
ncbi:MAG: hypothetical protein WCX65_11110 [bacterium]